MDRHTLWIALLSFGFCWGSAGCGSKESPEELAEGEDPISELGESGSSNGDVKLTSAPKGRMENLELRLKVGDRFPLMKTVEQRLRQLSAKGGQPIESSSQLTMTLSIQVEDISDGVKRLGVRYQRVRYEHDIAGDKVRYDSAVPEKEIPAAAQVYHGLVDNGFSFLLSADNRIMKVIDFDEFLKRCARHAPPAQQQELMTRLVASTEDEGIANFVDDSIGILPYNIDSRNAGGSVKIGDFWTKSRQVMRPIPMTVDTRYQLESANDRYANVVFVGRIVPAQIESIGNTAAHQTGLTEKMTLREGHSHGSCSIDRETGLPIQSRVVRNLNLRLELPNGAAFSQQKEVVTTVRAFPQQRSGKTAQTDGNANDSPGVSDSDPGRGNGPAPRNSRLLPTGFERNAPAQQAPSRP